MATTMKRLRNAYPTIQQQKQQRIIPQQHQHHYISGLGDGNVHDKYYANNNDENNNNNKNIKRIVGGDDYIERRRRHKIITRNTKDYNILIDELTANNQNNKNYRSISSSKQEAVGVGETEEKIHYQQMQKPDSNNLLRKGNLRIANVNNQRVPHHHHSSIFIHYGPWQISAIALLGILGLLLALFLHVLTGESDGSGGRSSKKGSYYHNRHHYHHHRASFRTKKKKTDEWSEDELPSDGSHYGPENDHYGHHQPTPSPIIHIKGTSYNHPYQATTAHNRYANQQTHRHRKVVATTAASSSAINTTTTSTATTTTAATAAIGPPPTSSSSSQHQQLPQQQQQHPRSPKPPSFRQAHSPKPPQRLTYNLNAATAISPHPQVKPSLSIPPAAAAVGGGGGGGTTATTGPQIHRAESDNTGLGHGLEGFQQQSYPSYANNNQKQQQQSTTTLLATSAVAAAAAAGTTATRIRPLSPVSSFPSLVSSDDENNCNRNNINSSLLVPPIHRSNTGSNSSDGSLSPKPPTAKATLMMQSSNKGAAFGGIGAGGDRSFSALSSSSSSLSSNKPSLVVPGMEEFETPRAGQRRTKNIPVQKLENQLGMNTAVPFSNEEQLLPFMPSIMTDSNNNNLLLNSLVSPREDDSDDSEGGQLKEEPVSSIEIESDREDDEMNAHMNLMESGQAAFVDRNAATAMSIVEQQQKQNNKAYPGHPNRNNNNNNNQFPIVELPNRIEISPGGHTDGATVDTTTTMSLSSKEDASSEAAAGWSSSAKVSGNNARNSIKHKRPDLTMSTDTESSLQAGSIDFNEIRLQKIIGGGGFGEVWKATWRGTPVAVKVLSGTAQTENVPKSILEEFAAEINMLKGMRHPNICLYMGACLVPPNRAIVTELAGNGSLWDALRLPLQAPYEACDGITRKGWPLELYGYNPNKSNSNSALVEGATITVQGSATIALEPPIPPAGTWPWPLVKRVACGAARGMTYLHYGDPPVLHRDLKSANLLLDESYTTKVCDFGLSRLKAQERSMTGNCGTVQWMAPEVLANQKYAEPADVYSFGIILWELLSRECPYDGMTPIACALAVLNRDHRPTIPAWCPPSLSALIRSCIQRDPTKRPTFAQIILALDAMPP